MRAWLNSRRGDGNNNSNNINAPQDVDILRGLSRSGSIGAEQPPPPPSSSSPSSTMHHRSPPPQQINRQSSSSGGGGGVFAAMMAGHRSHAAAMADAEMERNVAIAARKLGDGVGKIVLAARMGSGGEWKERLLALLGGGDEEDNNNNDVLPGSGGEGTMSVKRVSSTSSIANSTTNRSVNSTTNSDDGDQEIAGTDNNYNFDPSSPFAPMGGSAIEEPIPDVCNIDILLENSTCERFVLRCVENELPPNLIHCLRLLRVLELQHDAAYANQQRQQVVAVEEEEEMEGGNSVDNVEERIVVEGVDDGKKKVILTPGPVSRHAASKVSTLLCLLCADPSVGEQLRPHLFGLLALSGASYPLSGVHIASAASDVIRAFSSNCLSSSLVWFLHDRKMIVHMTDDIKELCGMTRSPTAGGGEDSSQAISSSSASQRCMYGSEAESAGLWVIALRTVVHLVANSCHFQCVELLKDYDGAGGYHILAYAIARSGSMHVTKLLELVTMLVCCRIASSTSVSSSHEIMEGEGDEGTELTRAVSDDHIVDVAENRVAMNTNAFEIMDDLMIKSIPLFEAYRLEHGGARPTFSGASLPEKTDFAVEYAWKMQRGHFDGTYCDVVGGVGSVDLTSELLVTTLQLYSDHAKNFDLIESEYHMLSHYILAFPTFTDVSVKVLTLKTLEYVCTGLTSGANSLMPLRVVTEVFVSECKFLLRMASSAYDDDSDFVLAALAVTGQDLQVLRDTLVKLLEFDENLHHIMLECGLLGSKIDDILGILITWLAKCGNDGAAPPVVTQMDPIYVCFCSILKLVARQPGARTVHNNFSPLLTAGIMHLGDSAAQAALDVFDAIMAKSYDDLLREDMICLLDLVDRFSVAEPILYDGIEGEMTGSTIDPQFIARQATVLDMIKSILPSNPLSQELFRKCGGFECLVRIIFRIEGLIHQVDPRDEVTNVGVARTTMKLLESAFALLTMATDPNSRNLKLLGDLGTPPVAIDYLTDETNVSVQSTLPPSTINLLYLRNYRFYIEFANAIAGVGILLDIVNARSVMNLALDLIHPKLALASEGGATKRLDQNMSHENILIVRNADAARLVLGLMVQLSDSDEHKSLAKNTFDELLRLCASDMAGSSLARFAASGLCASLTSKQEFAFMLEDRSHFLYSRFVLLLRRVAAYSMTYNDFVSLLRCVAGPIILAEQDDDIEEEFASTASQNKRIRLAVVFSSIQNKRSSSAAKSELWQSRETGFCNRLETLSVIAERGDRVARCEVGGDTFNTISTYMQTTPLEERLYKLAEQGRLKFLEIESVDSSTKFVGSSPSDMAIWNPLVSSGFTYCVWMRLQHPLKDGSPASLFMFDISSPPIETTSLDGSGSTFTYASSGNEFFSFWYDISNQRFRILTSSSSRGEPTSFPVSPLPAGVWHHIQLSYQAPIKRAILGRRAVVTLHINGRSVESEAKVEAFNLPPNARIQIGVPNPVLASSGILRGSLPFWDLGPMLLVSSVLSLRDATAMYTAGPEFPGLFWGDRPQRLSLAAAATSAFVMLADNGEKGSVAGALRRRQVPNMEAVGHVVMQERGGTSGGPESDSLSVVNLLCKLPPESIVFAFRASSSSPCQSNGNTKLNFARRLINVSRINSNGPISTDAVVYGYSSIISPNCFADNVQWIGGPNILMPIVNATQSSSSLALSLRIIRESVKSHPPNLEMLQAGGGYRMLALLLRQKRIMDANVLDQCFAFAVHGFVPGIQDKDSLKVKNPKGDNKLATHRWLFADLDAMKYLLLNHQVWDLNGGGPDLPTRLLSYFNGLVVAQSMHAAFNSRRLHLLGIIRWTLHLMLEATELFAEGASAAAMAAKTDSSEESMPRILSDVASNRPGVSALAAFNNGWFSLPPLVTKVASGRDPENEMLSSCKTLLRRVLTFMLTPGDLEAIAGAAIYTVSITGGVSQESNPDYPQTSASAGQEMLAPGAVARVYLLRLLEELVVDGVNEIVTDDTKISIDAEGPTESSVVPHSGGGTYLGMPNSVSRKKRSNSSSESNHPKHQEAQIFLSAFAGILTPVWFACILEGCREEASASAVLRLMVLMIQNSRKFANSFEAAGGFAPLVLSIPRYSTCPSIILPLLSRLLNAPILHLPSFATLDSKQLCDVFDAESDAPGLINDTQESRIADPSCGIFALLAECLGRNIQLASFDNELGFKARKTNDAILQLLSHRHAFSASFQLFCRSRDFLEPLSQALCLVHDEKLQRSQSDITNDKSTIRRSSSHSDGTNSTCDSDRDNFVDWPSDSVRSNSDHSSAGSRRGSLDLSDPTATPTERLVGKSGKGEGAGVGMVQLLFLVLSHAVLQGPLAAPLVSALFRSYPIHAAPDQVEVFQLVLIEHCRTVVNDALQRGEPIAIANCIGLSSVLLDRLMAGFFTSEGVIAAVNIVMFTLNSLTGKGTYASRLLKNDDQNLLVADAAHIARLTCLTAIHRSRPIEAYDESDHDLKLAVLTEVSASMRQLLLVPSMSNLGTIRKNSGNPSPAPSSRIFPLWQSASLSRCCPASISCAYPDLSSIEEPDKAFVVALTADLLDMLLDEKKDIREQAVVVLVSLLQRRRGIMSELLITDIPRSDQRMETVDLMNRGGFGTLLVAHEATTIAENVGLSSLQQDQTMFGSNPGKIKYASFFEWLERNQEQVAAVFHGIQIQAMRMSIISSISAVAPDEAIEIEQKNMLLKLTSRHSSDRTILGGLERADLAHRSHDATADSHVLWKRQGFDDLSSGAMQWKILSRQLKGSCTIWEGDFIDSSLFDKSILVSSLLNRETTNESTFLRSKSLVTSSNDTVKRWKLDLTEGYERQRRRLLPNYEFHGLYNIDEKIDNVQYVDEVGLRAIDDANVKPISDQEQRPSMLDIVTTANAASKFLSSIHPVELEVTADLLSKMNLVSSTQGIDEDDDYDYDGMDDELNDTDTTLISTHAVSLDEQSDHPTEIDKIEPISDSVQNKEDGDGLHEQKAGTDEGETERTAASSYDLITGLLKSGDWPEKSYNVSRCTGLEVRKALLLWCRHAIYVIDGFEQTDSDGLKGKIKRLKKATTSYQVSIRQRNSENPEMPEKIKGKDKSASESSEEEITYQHRSQRIPFSDVYSVYRRRYQLQQNALEFYDVHRNGTLLAFTTHADREEVLSKVLATPLPSSIFSEYSSVLSGSTSLNYKKFMNNLRSKITSQWVQGKITNFDFIMHMNSFAGRTYNDLTQYPVFPWVLADYRSEVLDLNDPKIYRDLSKPMGAQGRTRAMQYKERYDSMEQSYQRGDGPPPFHYGTHYSCAAYVLHYLMRLEPFSRLALSLQGGKFDVADRLFHNIGSSWTSASSENLQDVRELIPEFFYLPDFLVNSNMFDFGITQVGKTVHDLTLPPWAKGDPKRFVRLHRQALESDYVSRNLHKWLDLIFGCKQRGKEAVDALNAFVHVTYEGQVDLDSIEDPIERESIIAQIQNFGQTPSRLERKPFPPRVAVSVFKERGLDLSSLSSLSTLTPPFCVVGAPQRVHLRVNTVDTCKVGMSGQIDSSVGDLCLVKGQLVGVGKTCALILPSKKYYRYGEPNNGVSVHVAVTTARYREANKVLSIHDGMHRGPISMAKPSLNGMWLVTGCVDSTVRVWKYNGQNMQLQATLCGHDGGRITSLDISTTFGSIVSGGADGKIIVWDLRTMTFLRQLNHPSNPCSAHEGFAKCFPVKSVSINNKNGNIVTLLHSCIRVFDINGNLVARQSPNDEFDGNDMPTCAISTDCPEWMESGIVAISGHKNGLVRLWGIDYDSELLVPRHTVPERVHSCPITALAISGEKMDTLLIGDVSGKMSACSTIKLDQLNANELTTFLGIVEEDAPRKRTATTIGSAKDVFGSLIMQM